MSKDNLGIAKATTYQIRSLHDFNFKPTVMQRLYNSYGMGFQTLDILRALNYWYPIANETMTVQEENRDIRTITVDSTNIVVAANAGDSVSFELHADDLDSLYNYYPRENFIVQFGSTADGFIQGIITNITASTVTVTLTVKPVQVTDKIDITYLYSGVELPVLDSAYAAETLQPEPTSVGYAERTHYAQIFKESLKFGGMELAKQKWVEVTSGNFFNKEFARVEFNLDRQEELAILMGEEVSVSAGTNYITATSAIDGGTVPVYKNKGIYRWIDELGGELNYAGATGIPIEDLDEASEYLEEQGITSDVVLVLCGGGYMRKIENSGISFMAGDGALSGTNVGSMPEAFLDKVNTTGGEAPFKLNIGFRSVKKGGILFMFHKLTALTDPKGLGITGSMLNDMAFMFPISMVKDRKSGNTIPNLSAQYVGEGMYSRKRVVGNISGMDGFVNQKFNYPIINDIDGTSTYWLSHVMFPFVEAFKALLHQRSS